MKSTFRYLWLILATCAPSAFAQCPPSWIPSNNFPGLNGTVQKTTMWDSDGTGPLPNVLVVAGTFRIAGNIFANGIATWNPATGEWAALGGGLGPDGLSYWWDVTALTILPNGDLIAGGHFGTADGAPANHIARWNGTQWLPLGSGFTGAEYPIVHDLVTMPNGDIVAAGEFTFAGGVAANNIARWNGSAWSPLDGSTYHHLIPLVELALLPDGKLAAASRNGTPPAAVWDGTDWTPLGSGSVAGNVAELVALPTGELIIAGNFTEIGTTALRDIALWNGSAWTALGGDPGCKATSIVVEPDGGIIASGFYFPSGSPTKGRVRRWNGTTWSSFSTYAPNDPILTSTLMSDGTLIVGGGFMQVDSVQASHIARLASESCVPLSAGIEGEISSFAALPDGDLIVGGLAEIVTGVNLITARISRWNGATWSPLGNGLSGTGLASSYVFALTPRPNGDVVAGGIFTRSGTTPVSNIASWNGTSWNPLAAGTNGAVWALATLPNGDIVAGGEFTLAGNAIARGIARWNGAQWFPLAGGLSGFPSSSRFVVFALHTLPNGDMIAGGNFTHSGSQVVGKIARWNGAAWSGMSSTDFNTVYAIESLPDGTIIANGLGGVAQLNGTTWTRLGASFAGTVYALKPLPNGNIVAGGFFTVNNLPAGGIALWNGSAWAPMGAGLSQTHPLYYAYTNAIDLRPDGTLAIGGNFEIAGGQPNPYFARYAFDPADFNFDGITDFFDYLDFVEAFANSDPAADFNNDAIIDFFDYLAFVQAFSTGC